jgi:hypothetical protein
MYAGYSYNLIVNFILYTLKNSKKKVPSIFKVIKKTIFKPKKLTYSLLNIAILNI